MLLDELSIENNSTKILMIVAVILLAIIATAIVGKITKLSVVDKINNANTHASTYLHVIRGVCNTAIILVAIYIILRIIGFDVKGMIAGVGVAGIVIGFALQDLLKDIITALGFIADGAFDIGDYIGIGSYEGTVVSFTLRKLTLYSPLLDSDVVINNREITKIEKLGNFFSYHLPVPNDKSPEECAVIKNDVMKLIKEIDYVDQVRDMGLQYFTDETIVYKIRVCCNMDKHLGITREANKLIMEYYYSKGMKFIQKDINLYHE